MWSGKAFDLRKVGMELLEGGRVETQYNPTPYTFTTVGNGKKASVDSAALSPPSWLLLDHTIAVIWSLFSLNPPLHQLSIDDLKWAYEFLKDVRNRKGEIPPDVKVCLKEIQDQLINLYARLTALQEEDFDEIAAVFGEKIIADTNSFPDSSTNGSALDAVISSGSLTNSGTTYTMPFSTLVDRPSRKDVNVPKKTRTPKHSHVTKDSKLFEETKTFEDEEIEKYIMSLFHEENKIEQHSGDSYASRSFIPTKKKHSTAVTISEMISSTDDSTSVKPKKEKTSKKVHCVAEMRSLKFQKSMKVQDSNGEEAAYSNLKAEIKRLTFNPNVSRNEIMKFLKEWRSEQVDRLHNELKRLNSIEELMDTVGKDESQPSLQKNSHLKFKELGTTKSKFSLCKSPLS